MLNRDKEILKSLSDLDLSPTMEKMLEINMLHCQNI